MTFKTIFLASLLALNLSALSLGEVPKQVSISGESGGLVTDGSEWNSSTLKEKVFVMFYVDPDEKSLNDTFSSALKSKQKEFPYTLYVKDKSSVLVKEWGLADNNSDIIIFAKNGKVLFHKDGKMSEIEENL